MWLAQSVQSISPDGTVTCALANITAGSIGETELAAHSVGTSELQNGSVTRQNLAPMTDILALPGEAFSNTLGGPVNIDSTDGGAQIIPTTDTIATDTIPGTLVAALYLPDGAAITDVSIWVEDSSTLTFSNFQAVELRSRPFASTSASPPVFTFINHRFSGYR